jgi:hypothetical protein
MAETTSDGATPVPVQRPSGAWPIAGAAWGVLLSSGVILAFNHGSIGLHSPALLYVAAAYWASLLILATLSLLLRVAGAPRKARGALVALGMFIVGTVATWALAVVLD